MQDLDKDDEALNRWKATLLAGAGSGDKNAKKVIVQKMSFVTTGRPDIELDLTGKLLCR